LLAGVMRWCSFTSKPMPCRVSAYCRGVRVVPLVNSTNGSCRCWSQRMKRRAPGRGRSPWLWRSPRTSVPSMSHTKPRVRLRRSSVRRDGRWALAFRGKAMSLRGAQLETEARLLHDELREGRALRDLAQEALQRAAVRVVMARRGAGGDHGVHLPG